MGFIICFLRTSRQHNSIMVVVDRLIKVAHLIPVKSTYLASDVAHVFIRDVVRLHGVPRRIVWNIGMVSSLPSFGRSCL